MLEIIAETVSDAISAEAGGATQIELVTDLVEEGLTPSAGMIERVCANVAVPVLVMIRPHARGFAYSNDDIEVMCSDVETAVRLGAAGLLLGCVTADGRIDSEAVWALRVASGGRPLHFHNAWQLCSDREQALEDIIALGFNSVRLHGGSGVAGKAADNTDNIRQFAQRAAGRVDLFLAGGVNAENAAQLVRATGVRNVHAGSAARIPPQRGGIVAEEQVRRLAFAIDQGLR